MKTASIESAKVGKITLSEALTGGQLSAIQQYLGVSRDARIGFDKLAELRADCITAIVAVCKDGGKVVVTKADVKAFLSSIGATELEKAVSGRLWPVAKETTKVPAKAKTELSGLAPKIATALLAFSAEEQSAGLAYLVKQVRGLLKAE